MSKIKNSGLDQYGAERSEQQQQFGTAGVEGVKTYLLFLKSGKFVVYKCLAAYIADLYEMLNIYGLLPLNSRCF